MDANERELILKEEVYALIGCAIEVLNVRGHGLHEKIYENCLCIECRLRGIPYVQQERHRVMYKGEVVGEYVPDLVLQGKLIVDAKTIERITDHERGQMLNYLRITGLPAGGYPELQTFAARVGTTGVDQRTANEHESMPIRGNGFPGCAATLMTMSLLLLPISVHSRPFAVK